MSESTGRAECPGPWTRHGVDMHDHQKWHQWIHTYQEWARQSLYWLVSTMTVTNQWTIFIAKGGTELKKVIHEAGIETVGWSDVNSNPIEEGIQRISNILATPPLPAGDSPTGRGEGRTSEGTRKSNGDDRGSQLRGLPAHRNKPSRQKRPKAKSEPGPTSW